MNSTLTKIKVIDNFLATKYFHRIHRMLYVHTDWKFSEYKVSNSLKELANYQMIHTFVDMADHRVSSKNSMHLNVFMEKLNAQAVFRIKANLECWRGFTPYYSDFHVDNGETDTFVRTVEGYENKKTADMITGIYYLNTCNGYTEFEDGTIVNSVSNRFVSFPATTKHRGVSQTDTKTRIVINFNYW